MKLKFFAGSSAGAPPLEIRPGTAVVLVGPNNSGKSLALREIENRCFGDRREPGPQVIESLELDFPTDLATAEKLATRFHDPAGAGPNAPPNTLRVGPRGFFGRGGGATVQFDLETLARAIEGGDLSLLYGVLAAPYTVRLDGRTRFAIIDPKPTGDLQAVPSNHLVALFKDDNARERLRKITKDAFDLHFVIDPTGIQSLRIRLSSRAPATNSEEQALDENARRFHAQAPSIDTFGDGVQAFIGLTSAVFSLPQKIILVDEPEAFLHPPLARRLGGILCQVSREREASLIAATHSPDFLIGCLESAADVSIVRLTYRDRIATTRTLPPAEVLELARDPLLRSTDVLSALFHNAAVVTEADRDRAFYAEMNRRLVSANRGIRDAVFVNAQNLQTIRRLVRPLRRIGVPAAAVADLDAINLPRTDWEGLLEACQILANDWGQLETQRAILARKFGALPQRPGRKDSMKEEGLRALDNVAKSG